MSSEENDEIPSKLKVDKPVFKKPLLIGKVGKFPKKIIKENSEQRTEPNSATIENIPVTSETQELKENEPLPKNEEASPDKQMPLPYKEPEWSGIPESGETQYKFEVLKFGSIIETINLSSKPFWVFGRLSNCDISMAHPTISRYHAVLQYRKMESDDQPKGFYLYDLSSTHGTFLNKNKLKPRTYVKVYVGHLLKLGLSSRSYLLSGPENDTQEESELTVTELKKRRQEELARREEAEKEAKRKKEEEEEAIQKKLEERGVDWGLGEDADEETDLSENPFAQTNNEELYLDDPKKAFRGFMEREGHDFEYDCTEQGMGQFLCRVELPIDDERGKPIIAEVLHKGKKKEAVIQCALEACRILDRYGLLRQATHESRKRKAKNWEENDFYDSDEDTFLDRTGTIEKKRETRMKAKIPAKAETYQSLLEKESELRNQIKNIEKQLKNSRRDISAANSSTTNEDSLDHYMKELKEMKLDKQTIKKLKTDLSKLKQDLTNVEKLVTIAKPVELPTLINESSKTLTSENKPKSTLPIFGKRLKVKVQFPERKDSVNDMTVDDDNDEEDYNDDSDGNDNAKQETETFATSKKEVSVIPQAKQIAHSSKLLLPTIAKVKKNVADDNEKLLVEFSKIDTAFKMIFPLMSTEAENYLKDIWSKMKSLHPNYSTELQESIEDLFNNYINSFKYTAVIDGFTKEIDLISDMIEAIKTGQEIVTTANKLISLAKEITLAVNRLDQDDEPDSIDKMEVDESTSEQGSEKKKKKNQRRLQQRQEKAEIEKRKGYEEDAAKEDYNMWIPPRGQTGDGRTSLNEKYGY